MQDIHNPGHPLWATIRVVVVTVCVTVVLALNADDFDVTELKSLAWIIPSLIGVEGITKAFTRSKVEQ